VPLGNQAGLNDISGGRLVFQGSTRSGRIVKAKVSRHRHVRALVDGRKNIEGALAITREIEFEGAKAPRTEGKPLEASVHGPARSMSSGFFFLGPGSRRQGKRNTISDHKIRPGDGGRIGNWSYRRGSESQISRRKEIEPVSLKTLVEVPRFGTGPRRILGGRREVLSFGGMLS